MYVLLFKKSVGDIFLPTGFGVFFPPNACLNKEIINRSYFV